MRRIEPEQAADVIGCMLLFAALLYSFGGWPAAIMLGAPLGFLAGLAMALRYC